MVSTRKRGDFRIVVMSLSVLKGVRQDPKFPPTPFLKLSCTGADRGSGYNGQLTFSLSKLRVS